ncbi:MAG: helix-hairpin-helix domain-containing protein [Myxococcota bacterium]
MKRSGTKVMAVVAVAFLALGAGEALAGKKVAKKQLTGVVNLNAASVQQLDLLPGIGEKAAKKIVEYRSKQPFSRVEDLTKVKGFGKKKLEKLKPFLTTSGPTTIKAVPMTAPAEATPTGQAQGRAPPAKR